MHVKNSSYDAFIDEFYLGRPVTPLNGEKKCIATISDTFHNTKYTGMTLRLGKYASNIDLDILYQSYYYLYGTVVNYVCIHKGYGPNVLEFDNGVEEIIPNFRLNFVDEMPDKYMYTAEKVDTVRCYGIVPPECKNLNNLTSIDAKLYVPKGAWPAYATHPFWSMFADINEMENESGIEDVKMQEESKNAVEVERYDVNGRVLAKPISGLNIVKMSNGKVKKVWVK